MLVLRRQLEFIESLEQQVQGHWGLRWWSGGLFEWMDVHAMVVARVGHLSNGINVLPWPFLLPPSPPGHPA